MRGGERMRCSHGGHGKSTPLSLSHLISSSDLKLRVRILIDGTLIIFRVKPEDAGKYTCVPSNSLGRSPSASAYLTVQCEYGQGGPQLAGGSRRFGGWRAASCQGMSGEE